MNNIELFNYSLSNQDALVDELYSTYVEKIVIMPKKGEYNDLTTSNQKVINYITTIQTLVSIGKSYDDADVINIIDLIIEEISKVDMNLTPFCQYFMVHNITNSIFTKLDKKNKEDILKFVISKYIKDRHNIYLSHGYTDTAIQVMSDNYCHKRKSVYGAYKIKEEAKSLGIPYFFEAPKEKQNDKLELYCLSADKDGKVKFKEFASLYGINLKENNTIKYPDAFIRIGKHFFVVEHKQMKEDGGDQDKTIEDVIKFISKTPEFKNLHYVSYVDGYYLNIFQEVLNSKNSKEEKKSKRKINKENKISNHYKDILDSLNKYGDNYFVNSKGFKRILEIYYDEYKK